MKKESCRQITLLIIGMLWFNVIYGQSGYVNYQRIVTFVNGVEYKYDSKSHISEYSLTLSEVGTKSIFQFEFDYNNQKLGLGWICNGHIFSSNLLLTETKKFKWMDCQKIYVTQSNEVICVRYNDIGEIQKIYYFNNLCLEKYIVFSNE